MLLLALLLVLTLDDAGLALGATFVHTSIRNTRRTASADSRRVGLQAWQRGLARLASADGKGFIAVASPQLQVFTLLGGSGDFGGMPHIAMGGKPFVAVADNVLSAHRCAGAPPLSGSCSFRNLYYASSVTSVPGGVERTSNSGIWTYAVAVPAAEVAAGVWGEDALRALVLGLEGELHSGSLSLSSRAPPHQSSIWALSVAIFSAEAAPASMVLREGPSSARMAPAQLFLPIAAGTNVVSCPSIGLTEAERSDHDADAVSAQCIPPGVAGIVAQPFFLLYRTNGANIGHSLWDDAVPFFSAIDDLGLTSRMSEIAVLHTEAAGPWSRTWGSRGVERAVRQLFSLISPNGAELVTLDNVLGFGVALFREISGGLTGMSAHNLRPDMRVYGADAQWRSIWRMRTHVLRAAGLGDEEIKQPASGLKINESSSAVSGMPQTIKLLFVRSKRPVRNEAQLLADIAAAFPELSIEALAWEELGGGAAGFRAEIMRLAGTHILLSGDGTVAMTVPFLPRGAVHIQLGVARPWGIQVQCDFLYSSLDHVRVLYYSGPLEVGEHGATHLDGFAVPFPKLEKLLRQALALLHDGFTVPVEAAANMSPSALLLSHLLKSHADFAEWVIGGMGGMTWEDWKRDAPYEAFAPSVYAQHVAKSPADAERFAGTVQEYCASSLCTP